MRVYKHISHLFTMLPMATQGLKNAQSIEDCGYISDAAVWVDANDQVTWVGSTSDMSEPPDGVRMMSCEGETWLPGLIDCHTHMIFGGQRSIEMMKKRSGVSYLDIAKQGGGIQSTVKMTRECPRDALFELTCKRLEHSITLGVKHVEIKTGYGLSTETELMMLEVIRDIATQYKGRIGITSTFLGAHAFPKDKSQEVYLSLLLNEMLPKVAEAKLATYCDVFIEENFFSLAQGRQVLERAASLGLKLKAHVDECNALGGVELAVAMGATSIDHGIKMTAKGIKALAQSETTCVLLPMTSFVLQEGYAPGRRLIDKGVRVAMATDFNPGSSPSQNLILTAQIGMIHYGFNPYEVLSAMTYNAACALDLTDVFGCIGVGKSALFSRFAYKDWQELLYWVGQPIPVIDEQYME